MVSINWLSQYAKYIKLFHFYDCWYKKYLYHNFMCHIPSLHWDVLLYSIRDMS